MVATTEGLRQIDLDRIRPNPNQPRQEFDQDALADLAESIGRDGLLQPVLVRPVAPSGHFELVAGERRWRAAQLAGLLKVPAVIREVPDDRLLELALVENLQRQDLNPIESAQAFRTLLDEFGLTQEEVAERVGINRVTVTNAVRLLRLPAAVRELIADGQLSTGHGKLLLSLENPQLQKKLAARAVAQGMPVRKLESVVRKMAQPAPATAPVAAVARDPNIRAAEKELGAALGTKVTIASTGKQGGGRLELHFFSHEEMERVYQLVLKAASL